MKSQIFNAPRILIAAPHSSSGKTLLTCALLRLLQNRGRAPIAYKCGPDFIDPMFHERILGAFSHNLDSFFCTSGQVQEIFSRNFTNQNADCAVIEGVMGLFDGLAGKSISASSYDIARITKTPILLVVDPSGMSRSVVPLVKGFLDYDKAQSGENASLIKAVFLNKCSKSQFELLKPQIEAECGVKVIGFLSKECEYVLKNRHLGLFLPSEIKNLQEEISKIAKNLDESLDVAELEKIMAESAPCDRPENRDFLQTPSNFTSDFPAQHFQFSSFSFPFTIAVARDEAFCFYYHENLAFLEELGAKITFFSPLHDSSLPGDASALLLGGGYPELYASALQENASMRHSIKSAVKNGIFVLAECGGFMYLQNKIIGSSFTKAGGIVPVSHGEQTVSYEMCGAIEGEARFTGSLVRFGYAEFTQNHRADSTSPLAIKGHEFHYFDSTNNGTDFTAQKSLSNRTWQCMIQTENMLAGFPHLYYRSCPRIIAEFLLGTAEH